jgi:hypothetical protein
LCHAVENLCELQASDHPFTTAFNAAGQVLGHAQALVGG